jgi:hypothetical protein
MLIEPVILIAPCGFHCLLQYAIRRDEANHRDVNHSFASIGDNDANPLVLDKAIQQPTKPSQTA